MSWRSLAFFVVGWWLVVAGATNSSTAPPNVTTPEEIIASSVVVVCGGRCYEDDAASSERASEEEEGCEAAVRALGGASSAFFVAERVDLDSRTAAVDALLLFQKKKNLTSFEAVIVDCEEDAFDLARSSVFPFSYVVFAPSSRSPRSAGAAAEKLLVRTSTPRAKVGEALVALANKYGWPRIGLVHDDDDDESLAIASYVVDELRDKEGVVVVGDACFACRGVRLSDGDGNTRGVAVARETFNETVAERVLQELQEARPTVILLATTSHRHVQRLFFAAALRKEPISVLLTAPSEESFFFDTDREYVDLEAVLGHEGALGFTDVTTNNATDRWLDAAALFIEARQDTPGATFARITEEAFDLPSASSSSKVRFDSDGDRLGDLELLNAQIIRPSRRRRLSAVNLTPSSRAAFVDVGEYDTYRRKLDIVDKASVVLFENSEDDDDEGVNPLDDDDFDDDEVTWEPTATPVPTSAAEVVVDGSSSSGGKKKTSPLSFSSTSGRGFLLVVAISVFAVALCVVLTFARYALSRLDQKNRRALLSSLNAYEVLVPFDPNRSAAYRQEKHSKRFADDDGDDCKEQLEDEPLPPDSRKKKRIVCKSGAVDAHGADVVEESVNRQRAVGGGGVGTSAAAREEGGGGDGDHEDEVLVYEDRPKSLSRLDDIASHEVECWYWGEDVATVAAIAEETAPDEEQLKVLPDTGDPRKCWVAYDDVVQDQISDVYARFLKLPADVRERLKSHDSGGGGGGGDLGSSSSRGGAARRNAARRKRSLATRRRHFLENNVTDDGANDMTQSSSSSSSSSSGTEVTPRDTEDVKLLVVVKSSSNGSLSDMEDFFYDVDPACYKIVIKQHHRDKKNDVSKAATTPEPLDSLTKPPRPVQATTTTTTQQQPTKDDQPPTREINVATMTQTNLRTGTTRPIKMEPIGRKIKLSWYWRENFRNLQKWKDAEVNVDGTLWVRYDSTEVQKALTALYVTAKRSSSQAAAAALPPSTADISSSSSSSRGGGRGRGRLLLGSEDGPDREYKLKLDAHNEITDAAPDVKYEIDVLKLWQTNLLSNFRRPVCVMMETSYTKATSPTVVAERGGSAVGGFSHLVLPAVVDDRGDDASTTSQPRTTTAQHHPTQGTTTHPKPSSRSMLSSSMRGILTPRSKAMKNLPLFYSDRQIVVPQMPEDIQGRDCLKLEVGMLVSVIHDHETGLWSFGREIVTTRASGRAGWFPRECVAPASKLTIQDIPDQTLQDFSFLLPPKHWNTRAAADRAADNPFASTRRDELLMEPRGSDLSDTETTKTQGAETTLLVDVAKSKEGKEIIAYFDVDYYDVVDVLRVENLQLWRPYATKRLTVAERDAKSNYAGQPGSLRGVHGELFHNDAVERYPVFHGTTAEAAMKICIEGFNRDFSSSTHAQHGRGPYFAVDAQQACFHTYAKPDKDGIQHVLVSRIIAGRVAKGSPGMMAPPFREDKSQRRYDATVDDVDDPQIFVTYSDNQAYPAYLVKLKRKMNQANFVACD